MLDKNQEILKYAHKIRYWCQDESRFGMKTVSGRKVTLPRSKTNWKRTMEIFI
ncbi:hypothetical protein [Okeania sp. KiyG1]|uniref:hypothetical protein n=1 Tax=Okeania sp. KiyG1 TaxID=2720165 RepID=UPI001923F11C|nr:hypothetical protein [Okeania sp. KiyG1]